MKPSKAFLFAGRIVAAVALVAAGCTGGSDSSGTASTTTTSTQPSLTTTSTPSPTIFEPVEPPTTAEPPVTSNPDVVPEPLEQRENLVECNEPGDGTLTDEAIQTAIAMLPPQLAQLFPELSESILDNLAIAYAACRVEISDLEQILASAAVGADYDRLINSLQTAQSYLEFVQINFELNENLPDALDNPASAELDVDQATFDQAIEAAAITSLLVFMPNQEELQASFDFLLNLLGGGLILEDLGELEELESP